jgi:hypothetical protein
VRELFLTSFKEISLALPLSPGIETISLSLFSPGQAEPNFTLIIACFNDGTTFFYIIRNHISSKGITAV